MNKSQTRFYNTTLKMHKALFDLLEKYDFQKITIKQITDKAGINRCTFYAHYENTYDLLKDTQESFVNRFFSAYKGRLKEIENLSIEESNFATEKYLLPYLTFVQENKKIFKIYLNNLNVFDSDKLFEYILQNAFIPICKKHGITNPTMVTYLANYYLMGITSVVMRWVERDCIDDIHMICDIIMLCVNIPNK